MKNEVYIKKIVPAMFILLFVSIILGLFTLKNDDEDVNKTSSPATEKQAITVTSNSTTASSGLPEKISSEKSSSTKPTEKSGTATKNSATSTTSATKRKTNPDVKVVNGISYVDGIMIVNKSYSLPSNYNPGIDAEADKAYYKMKEAAQKDGVSLFVVSDFRSYETQESIYNRYVSEDGKAEADRYSARPGHSEHQTGLAYDLNSLSSSFGETTEGKWLAKHCWEYGFIIRFPEGKESITGYMYEPWHVRYLGEKTAKAVYDSGLTLEEYLGVDSVYSD